MSVERYTSDTASYKKRIARDCLFISLKYGKLISKNSSKNQDGQLEKKIQINEARNKLMKLVPGTTRYDIGWWRRCEDDRRITFGTTVGIEFDEDTQSIPVVGTA